MKVKQEIGSFQRIVCLGTTNYTTGQRTAKVFCKITYEDKKSNQKILSIHGVVGPKKNGDAYGSCGQIIYTHIVAPNYKEDWNFLKIQAFYNMWERWHLNDMCAGTPTQEKLIRKWEQIGNKYTYEKACAYLKSNDMYIDDGYIYGSKWLYEAVDPYALEFLKDLTETSIPYAWV